MLPSPVAAQAERALAPRAHIDTSLNRTPHRYDVRLRRGESLALVVNQRGVDVVVDVLDERDSLLQSVDSPNGRQGPEPLELFSPSGGHYIVIVRPMDNREPGGPYTLDVTGWRDSAATEMLLSTRRQARDSAARWLRRHGTALDSSLAPLERLAGRASVVALGEATHGSREFGDVRLRLTRYLVERMGYRIVALENSMSRLAVLDRYTRGEMQSRDSINPVLDWGWIGRRTLRELVTWLRQWNDAHPRDQVHLVGLDAQDNVLARQTLRAFIARAYPEAVPRYMLVEQELAAADSQTWVFGNSSVDSSARNFLHEQLARIEADAPLLRYLFDTTLVRAGADAARQLFQFADFNTARDAWSRSRDWYMAANVLEALQATPTAKAVLWAHNEHVRAVTGRSPSGSRTGTWLRAALGCRYGAIALAFDAGGFVAQLPNDLEDRLAVSNLPPAPDESIEGVLRIARPPPLRASIATWGCAERARAPDWLQQPQRMHWVGALYAPATAPSATFYPHRLTQEFDGIVFLPRVTADEAPTDRPLVPARRLRQE
jgi:erythromycin esterase